MGKGEILSPAPEFLKYYCCFINWDFWLAFSNVSILFAVLRVYKNRAKLRCFTLLSDFLSWLEEFALSSFIKQGAVTTGLVIA